MHHYPEGRMDRTATMWGMFGYLRGNELKVPLIIGKWVIYHSRRSKARIQISRHKKREFNIPILTDSLIVAIICNDIYLLL